MILRALALVASLGLTIIPGPSGAEAQPPALPRIGWLSNGTRTGLPGQLEAFRQGLRDLGYVEGRNVVIELRFAEGKSERLPALAAELVRLSVSVIVAENPPALRAASQATRTIPIVARVSDDPVASGLVASLARPGGNITGVYSLAAELSAKRLELLREALPGITRVAVLLDSASPGSRRWLAETEVAAHSLGVRLELAEAKSSEDLAPAFRSATRAHAQALITLRNPVIATSFRQIVSLAAQSRLPAMYDAREFVEAGGLMSYGTSLTELYRRAATHVDKILRGAKPGELPIEQPTRFELVINLRTAKALGLTIPQPFLSRADEVIQ